MLAVALAATACDRPPERADAPPAVPAPAVDSAPAAEPSWSAEVGGSGMALVLSDTAGAPLLRIACVRDPALMTILVEGFHPVASEEQLSFGVDEEPFVFVADPTADLPSGVAAEAPIPEDLLDRFAGATEARVVYGYQRAGPYPPPDPELRERFVRACREIAGR